MNTIRTYVNYPIGIVLIANLLSISIYALGFFILWHVQWILSVLFITYVLFLEIRLIKNHCIECYYYGKLCAFGKGKISSWFFKKGDPSHFCSREITWKTMIPDLLISLIPVIAGVVLLILSFNLIILFAIILLITLTTIGNGYVRTSMACKYCQQRLDGCPADKLFNKEKESN